MDHLSTEEVMALEESELADIVLANAVTSPPLIVVHTAVEIGFVETEEEPTEEDIRVMVVWSGYTPDTDQIIRVPFIFDFDFAVENNLIQASDVETMKADALQRLVTYKQNQEK